MIILENKEHFKIEATISRKDYLSLRNKNNVTFTSNISYLNCDLPGVSELLAY